MKRYSTLLAMLLLAIGCASAAHAIFPGPIYGTVPSTTVGDGYLTFTMQQGWYNGRPAWYICTDTNDIRWAQWHNLTLAPKLSSAFFGAGASAMFVVLNPAASQGPIFETRPGKALYTPIWRVRYVTWKPGATKVPLTSIGQILALQGAGQLTWVDTDIRVDCPILAVGQLGGPWQSTCLEYKIPQGRIVPCSSPTKQIQLPYWNVYCRDPITRAIGVRKVIIPDAYPQSLAALIGANIAPRLAGMPNSDRTLFNVINWAQDFDPNLPGIQPLKVLTNQYPVVCDCPDFCSWRNTNFDYSPVMTFALLNRLYPTPPGAPVPAETLYQTCDYIRHEVLAGRLQSVLFPTPPLPAAPVPVAYPPNAGAWTYVLNAPVICNGIGGGGICP